MQRAIVGAQIFDGHRMHQGAALLIDGDRITGIVPETECPDSILRENMGGVIAPAFVDLQVNGGDGLMVDGSTDVAALHRICATHGRLGTAGLLPTLITDTAETTARVIAAGRAAARAQVPGFLGLHLEGPHLDPHRKGAHDAALIRPMSGDDLARLCDAARQLPALMVTLAPEAASPVQIATLTTAGAVVSLGHSDCDYDTAMAAIRAGARCATHLFNAMSQIGNRAPGLAGTVLSGTLAAGLIADGHHVHPATLRLALAARNEGLFLVTDAMALAGTDLTEFTLNGRRILRRDGRLTLPNGTLAGADLSMPQAVRFLVRTIGLPLERALAMASRIPAEVIGANAAFGRLDPGRAADLVHLSDDLTLMETFHDGSWHGTSVVDAETRTA